jgi:hypothetical protein
MYGVFSQNKNPERLIHEHLIITGMVLLIRERPIKLA